MNLILTKLCLIHSNRSGCVRFKETEETAIKALTQQCHGGAHTRGIRTKASL